MSIIIDARGVQDSISGIDRHVLGLLTGIAECNTGMRVTVLGTRCDALLAVIDHQSPFQFVECTLPPWSIRSQLLLPALLKRLGCAVYHCPYLFAPLKRGDHSTVITVHDLIPTLCREEMRKSWKVRLGPLWDRWFRAQCAAAAAIVTVSDFTRTTLVDTMDISPERVHRIHNGVESEIRSSGFVDVRARFNLKGRIILYVGRHDPYKNIVTLVHAFDQIIKQHCEPLTLVIGGKLDRRYPEAQQAAHTLGIADRVVFTDYFDDDTRLALLNEASVFAFPSRHEGFGLPPLEAMAQGVPVVASNATSLPEVLGDAALLVNPNDSNGLAEAILSIMRDGSLAEQLRARGVKQAARFTWKQCAAAHLQLYQQLLERRSDYAAAPTARAPAGAPLLKNPIT